MMDAEEIGKIVREAVREELVAQAKKDKPTRVFYAFALWVGVITLLSFLFTYWVAREQLPQNEVDTMALILIPVSFAMVILVIWFLSRDSQKK